MKKEYVDPEMELLKFGVDDVIITSGSTTGEDEDEDLGLI